MLSFLAPHLADVVPADALCPRNRECAEKLGHTVEPGRYRSLHDRINEARGPSVCQALPCDSPYSPLSCGPPKSREAGRAKVPLSCGLSHSSTVLVRTPVSCLA